MAKAVKTDVGQFAIVPLWLIERANPSALRVYALLAAKWADRDTGECFPFRSTMAEILAISERSVTRAIADLVELGAISVKPQYDSAGDQTCNLYTVFTSRPPLDKYDQGYGHQRPGVETDLSMGIDTDVQAEREPEPYNENHPPSPQPLGARDEESGTDLELQGPEQTDGEESALGSPAPADGNLHSPAPASAMPQGSGAKGSSTGRPPWDPTASDPEVIRLCNLLADLIARDGSDRPNPDQKAWHDACRLLMTKGGPDGKGWPVEKIEKLLRWSQDDKFWSSNILSMPKFREKYTQLRKKANEEHAEKGVSASQQSTSNQIAERRRKLQEGTS